MFFAPENIVFEYSPTLIYWVWTWVRMENIEPLTPEGCFEGVHILKWGGGTGVAYGYPIMPKLHFLKIPPYTVVDLVLKQLGGGVTNGSIV